VEVENPLKSYSNATDFAQLPQFEGNLLSLAEAHETTRQKSEKAKSKGKAKKQEEKAREENDARALWETESPLILEKLQTIDEARLVLLKDLFVKSMMMDIETSQSSVSDAEGVVNSLLSLNPAKEIEVFVAQQKDLPKPSSHERRRSTISSNQVPALEPAPSTSTRPSPAQARRTMPVTDDDGLIRTDKRKSRFGTILRSSRSSIRTPNLLRGSSPDKKRKDTEQERAERDQTQNIKPVNSQTSQNGVTLHSEPIAPARSSSIANIESQQSPVKEDQPAPPLQAAEEAEGGSILSNDSTYAPPLRVEIKDQVIPEEAGEREAAFNTLQSTLRAQPTVSRKSRGRRDGRSSFVETEANEFGIMPPPTQAMRHMSMSPISPTTNALTLSPIRIESDAQSLLSVRTTSRPSTLTLHPDLGTPGFNISVLEFLSVILSQNQVQKIFVTGELAVSSNEQRASGIRLENTGNIEQVVSNTTYLNDTGGGTYALTNENLPPKGAIVLKYKTSLIANPQSQVPLLIRAKWRMEPGSLLLMIAYHSNPLFPSHQNISNIVFTATLPTDIRVQACQSKPQGQFSGERRQLVWNFPSADEVENVLIAKFSVEGQSKGEGMVEASWECKGVIATGIEVSGIGAKNPFADEEDLFFQANVLRNLVSGKYICQP
jgi:F-BAR domain only protein